MLFMQQEKLFKCLVSFLFLHKHTKINRLQICIEKSCLGNFLKILKCGHLIMCWIGKPVTGCYTTYIPMLILCYFEYTTVVKKYQVMKLL